MTILILPVFIIPIHAFDLDFTLECSTWYESYEITSKSEFIMVWGKGSIECYKMLDSWAGKLFLWHNEGLISDLELKLAINYLVQNNSIDLRNSGEPEEISTTKEKLPKASISPKSIRFGQPVTITVVDPDLNVNQNLIDIYRVVNDPKSPNVDTVGTPEGGALLEIKIKDIRYQRCIVNGVEHGGLAATGFTLEETGPSSGIFEGVFRVPTEICNKNGTELITTAGGTIVLKYFDFRDVFGESNIQSN